MSAHPSRSANSGLGAFARRFTLSSLFLLISGMAIGTKADLTHAREDPIAGPIRFLAAVSRFR